MSITSVVNVIPGVQAGNASQVSPSSSFDGMGSSEFMMILLTQLRHQNPLEPMDDRELISQMTQLNSLEELKKINTTLEKVVQMFQMV